MNANRSELQQQLSFWTAQIKDTAATIVTPPPDENAGEWADRLRVLPPESPEPGPWRTERVPFWSDIYEAFSDPSIEQITVCCGAQMSKTEGVFNLMAHRLDQGPYCPVLYIGPTEKFVKAMAADRWKKVLKSVPSLWAKTGKGHLYKTAEQFVGGIRCGWAWAGSASEVAGHPAGLVLVDERSRMSAAVGGEGDPVSLARARTKNYPQRKIGIFSTPTIWDADPTIDLMEEGALYLWAWACLHCGAWFVPTLALLKWDKGEGFTVRESAHVACPHCGGVLANADKPALNRYGAYLPHRLRTDTEPPESAVLGRYVQIDAPIPSPIVGFWISGLASPWAEFGAIAAVLAAAYSAGDPAKIQAEVNTWGGEPWRARGEAPEISEVLARRQPYRAKSIPAGVRFLTLGADVQKRGIYYVVRGWGVEAESWLIDRAFVEGETEFDDVWLKMGQILTGHYGDMSISRAFFDSGYRPGDSHVRPDHAVYTFCRRYPTLAFPSKGQESGDVPVKFAAIDYTLGGKRVKSGVKLYHINTDYHKRWVYSRINWPAEAAGGWWVFAEIDEDYCRQVVSEELVLKASGRSTWVRVHRENHYLDCEVLAYAAATVQGVHKLTAAPAPPAQAPPADSPARDRAAPRPKSPFSRRTIL